MLRRFTPVFLAWILLGTILLFGVDRVSAQQEQYYNFKIGDMLFNLTGTFSIQYNSNVTNSGIAREDDFILSPGVFLQGTWEIGQLNDFTFTIGISADKYLKHSELDSLNNFLTIAPDSEVSFTVLVGEASLTFFDRLNYSVDGANAFGLNPDGSVDNNVTDYGRFDNRAGVDVVWDLNDVQTGFTFARTDIIPTSNSFNFTRRTQYDILPFVEANVNPDLTVGLRGTLSKDTYQENFNNNSTSYGLGPFVEWAVLPNWTVGAGAEYMKYHFDNNGRNGDASNPDGLEYNFVLTNTPSLLFEHRIFALRDFDYGFISNLTKVDVYGYAFQWQVARKAILNGGIAYIKGKDSGGLDPESYTNWNPDIGLTYYLSSKFSAQLNYQYSMRRSNIPARTYPQHILALTLFYDF